jgi:hypothetical protein
MKAVPLLVVTNVIALGMAAVALMNSGDDTSSSGSRSSRASSAQTGATGNDQLEAKIADLQAQIARMASERPAVKATSAGESAATATDGDAIDRTYGDGEFDTDAAKADPAFANFRARVRLAGEENQREDSINSQVDRLDQLISENRIGTLSKAQKTKVAEKMIEQRGKTRMIWRGLRNREDLQNLPDDERRTAYRDAFRKEQETIKTETKTVLEGIMPAADAQTLMESGGGGFGGGGRTTRRSR